MKTKKDSLLNIGIILAVIIVIIIAVFALKPVSSPKQVQYKIVLQGDRYITINEDENYVEPGYIAYADNEVITNQVVVESDVKSIPGIYKVLYKINDYTDYRIVEVKRLIDYELELTVEASTTSLTNEDVTINVSVTGETFSSLMMPNGSIVYSSNASFTVQENGTYIFKAINERNETFTKSIDINNIDKTAPTGSCSATLNNNNTVIKVTTSDTNIKYSYYDNDKLLITNTSNSYTTSSKTSEKITVVLEDEVTNKTKITCTTTDKRYFEPIKPSSSEKIVFHGESETFKTYIVERSGYYLTYFWVRNAYTQLNKYDSPEYGSRLYYPSDLLRKAISNYNLSDKLIVGFNASGFYLKDVFDAASVSKYPAYNKTSVGTLVITNGKVVRNAYNHADKTWFMVGINKDNKLLVFEDKASNNAEEKKAWSQTVIDSGIRNTYSFAAPLIQNGKRANITTSMPGGFTDPKGLQIIGQINDNNFLLFTSKNAARNTAIDAFLKLGCQTAMNLDGGGSVALLYKAKGSTEIKRVIGNGRELTEVGYFTE